MDTAKGKLLLLAILAAIASGGVSADDLQIPRNQERLSRERPGVSRITFGSNFFADVCNSCKYNPEPSGYSVLGPDNCTFPGATQSVAVAFVARASGRPDRISTSLILTNPRVCPKSKVTLGLYEDECGKGPGSLLISAEAKVGKQPCDLTVAKLINAPALTEGIKYWIAATTTAAQSQLDSRWYVSNTAGYSLYTAEQGWQPATGITPAFSIQGSSGTSSANGTETRKALFGGNLSVDPCTGCNYDPNGGGFDVRGPENCSFPGQTNWEAVPFIAERNGVPKRISAAILLYNPRHCPFNKVTLSLYSDSNCGGIPGELLVSAEATVPLSSCDLAVAELIGSPSLTKGTKYWVVATTNDQQSALEARWSPSNAGQFAADLGTGWLQTNGHTPAFLVE